MSTRYQPRRLYRTAMILGAVLYAAAVTPLAAQQVRDSARVAPQTSAEASTPATATAGPRPAPRFQSFEPTLARSTASVTPSPMPAGGSHTIVISTLALVLIIIIVVLLLK